jgi:DivIVA domain-containing protein
LLPAARRISEAVAVNGEEIRATRFLKPRWSGGYNAPEVDELLARVAAELDAGRPAGPLIETAAFRRPMLLVGKSFYDIDAVDWFLGQFLAQDRLEPGGVNADPWRDLTVTQLTRSSASAAKASQLADREDFSGECAGAWHAFGQLPGVHLRWERVGGGRSKLRTAEDEAVASLQNVMRGSELMIASIGGRSFSLRKTGPASSPSPGIAEITARCFRDKRGHFAEAKHSRQQPYMRIDELADEAGALILYVSGAHDLGRAGTCITFPDQRWLRFLVRGTEVGNAIMTALDQAGNSVARYRIIQKGFRRGWQTSVEITVRPGRQLTDDLALAIAISAPWLNSYFPHYEKVP